MSKLVRKKMVTELSRKLEGASSGVLLDYRGMRAAQTGELRSSLRREKIRMTVLKNAVAKHAFKTKGWEALTEKMSEMSALVYGADPVAMAKILHAYREKNNNLPKVRAAVIDGALADARQVEVLSKLPSKEQLLGQFVGLLAAPASGFVRVLAAVPSKFVRGLAAVRDQKEKG